jgi:hypothetical protein
MLVLIPLVLFIACGFLFWNLFSSDTNKTSGWREAFLAAAVLLGAFVAVTSEGLSLLKAVDRPALIVVWLVALALTIVVLWRRAGLTKKGFNTFREISMLRDWSKADQISLLVLLLFTGILFLVARIAPPNTNDSLSYHMSRVMHWMQNQGLEHYPTTIDRQLWMPPWAEMAVMQLYLFKGDDGLSNLVQWFSMGGSLVVVSLIAKRLGAGVRGQLFAALFCVTLPMGILQATSTQTDYVSAFWLVVLAYYALLAHQRCLSALEWLLLCLVVALGVMTKGTFNTYALPFLLWLLVSILRHEGWFSAIKYASLGLLVVGVMNAGVWARNIHTYGFPLGPSEAVGHLTNEALSPAVLLSNLVRNSTLNLGTPYGVVNGPFTQLVEKIHQVIGQDLNDSRTTLDEYRIKRYLHEDRAGNPFHFLLIPLTLFALFRLEKGQQERSLSWVYTALVLATFLIFSVVYKWQSTGNRLLLPFFVAWAPLAGLALGKPQVKYPAYAVGLILVVAGIQPLLSNPSRALLPFSPDFASLLTTPRAELLFANSPEVMPAYLSLASDIKESGCQQVGIIIKSSDAEYPLWFLLKSGNFAVRVEHLDAPPPSGRYLSQDFQPCAIVCTLCADDSQHGLPLAAVYQGTFFLYMNRPVPLISRLNSPTLYK